MTTQQTTAAVHFLIQDTTENRTKLAQIFRGKGMGKAAELVGMDPADLAPEQAGENASALHRAVAMAGLRGGWKWLGYAVTNAFQHVFVLGLFVHFRGLLKLAVLSAAENRFSDAEELLDQARKYWFSGPELSAIEFLLGVSENAISAELRSTAMSRLVNSAEPRHKAMALRDAMIRQAEETVEHAIHRAAEQRKLAQKSRQQARADVCRAMRGASGGGGRKHR